MSLEAQPLEAFVICADFAYGCASFVGVLFSVTSVVQDFWVN